MLFQRVTGLQAPFSNPIFDNAACQKCRGPALGRGHQGLWSVVGRLTEQVPFGVRPAVWAPGSQPHWAKGQHAARHTGGLPQAHPAWAPHSGVTGETIQEKLVVWLDPGDGEELAEFQPCPEGCPLHLGQTG